MTFIKTRGSHSRCDHPEFILDSVFPVDGSLVLGTYSVGREWVFKEIRAGRVRRLRVFNHKISAKTKRYLPDEVRAQYDVAVSLSKKNRKKRKRRS